MNKLRMSQPTTKVAANQSRLVSDTRKEMIIALRITNPCLTCQDIGMKTGVTRERVRQILNDTKLPTLKVKRHRCIKCNKPTNNKLFCSMSCFSEYHSIQLLCTNCNKLFSRKISSVLDYDTRMKQCYPRNSNGKMGDFCNRRCFGQWIAKHYGFGVIKKGNNIQ